MRKFVLSVLLVSFAIAGVLYHFAAQAPDGLEKTMENLGAEEADHLVPSLFPDYEFPLLGRVAGKTVAGVVGTATVFIILLGVLQLLARGRQSSQAP